MQRKRLTYLLDILEKEVKLAKRRAEELRVVANEVSKTARSSRSAAGERFLTQGQAQAAEEYFKRMLDFGYIVKFTGCILLVFQKQQIYQRPLKITLNTVRPSMTFLCRKRTHTR